MHRNRTIREAIENAPACCKTCPIVILLLIMCIIHGCSATWSILLPDGKVTEGDVHIEPLTDDADDNP